MLHGREWTGFLLDFPVPPEANIAGRLVHFGSSLVAFEKYGPSRGSWKHQLLSSCYSAVSPPPLPCTPSAMEFWVLSEWEVTVRTGEGTRFPKGRALGSCANGSHVQACFQKVGV